MLLSAREGRSIKLINPRSRAGYPGYFERTARGKCQPDCLSFFIFIVIVDLVF